jgi:hypothetical protein
LNYQAKGRVNISRLRKFAIEELPRNWVLREVLIAEDEEVELSVFLARVPLWLRLSTLRGGSNK